MTIGGITTYGNVVSEKKAVQLTASVFRIISSFLFSYASYVLNLIY